MLTKMYKTPVWDYLFVLTIEDMLCLLGYKKPGSESEKKQKKGLSLGCFIVMERTY